MPSLTLYIRSLLRMFSDSQGGSLLLLSSSSQQISYTLIIDLQEAAGTETGQHPQVKNQLTSYLH